MHFIKQVIFSSVSRMIDIDLKKILTTPLAISIIMNYANIRVHALFSTQYRINVKELTSLNLLDLMLHYVCMAI